MIATHTNGVRAVTPDTRDTIEIRCTNDAPLGLVVVEQALEIGDEYRTVLVYFNIKVTVVSVIFCRREVSDQRKTLAKGG